MVQNTQTLFSKVITPSLHLHTQPHKHLNIQNLNNSKDQ